VFRSARHIVAQIIDDAAGRTLVQATSCEKALRGQPGVRKSAVAEAVGKQLAARCVEKGITRVAFDRGGYRFHGRVAALAKGAREGGLKF
jgi:large subunit ribosomal protein L18